MKNKSGTLFFILSVIFAVSSSRIQAEEIATFAGGCFWCVAKPFTTFPGVSKVISGYTGGDLKNPTYEQVSSGQSGHFESVQISFDPKKIAYEKLLEGFWQDIDPTDGEGQFADRGSQYRPAIFYHSVAQKNAAEKSKQELEKSKKFKSAKIQVLILPAKEFYPAETYHQDYAHKNPQAYERYFEGSGRKRYLEKTWPRP